LVVLGISNLAFAAMVITILSERLHKAKAETDPARLIPTSNFLQQVAGKLAFWLLLLSFAVYTGIFSTLSYHLYPLLMERGFEAAAVVSAIAIIGPAQVAGRIGVSALAGRLPISRLGSVVVAGFPPAALLLLTSGSYQRRVISSNERPVFHRIPSRIMEVISRRWYQTSLCNSWRGIA
jgi:predicted MFS family arabinose efflux permease